MPLARPGRSLYAWSPEMPEPGAVRAPAGPSGTEVTLSYDWSAVPDSLRQQLPFPFPPFAPDHLSNSLAHLAELATA